MPQSAYQLFKDKVDPKQIGNPKLRQALMRMYDQNYRQQLEQVNANYQAALAQGMTPGQAATTWVLPNGPNAKYTVKDGQTLPDVAKAAGTTPADIVNANPQMSSPQTGMVLNIPKPDFTGVSGLNGTQYGLNRPGMNTGTQQYSTPAGPNPFAPPNVPNAGRANRPTPPGAQTQQPAGGMGLPQNAAQGATTTNPQGTNPLANAYNSFLNFTGVKNYNPNGSPTPAEQMINPNAGKPPTGFTPITGATPPSTGPNTASVSPMPNIPPSNLSPIFAQKLQTGNLNPDELKYAIYKGWVAPANRPQTQTFGSGIAFPKGNPNNKFWNSNRGKSSKSPAGRGGGGGNGGGVQPRYTQQNNTPAFSSGAGFGGLVNWRV